MPARPGPCSGPACGWACWRRRASEPAGRIPTVLESLDAYGRCFGLAFQITDDLLDVEGTAEQTASACGKDAARGKLTYPGFLGATESRRRAEQLCRQACEHLLPLGPASARPPGGARSVAIDSGKEPTEMTQSIAVAGSPRPPTCKQLSDEQLGQLAQEMRDELVRVLSIRPAHFASNLGVVELCLALHLTFDFSRDRLIWDTGHQIYPHKLITGRYPQFETIRTRGGLMGYPNPHESPYDLFMTGHAGCSVSCALGLKVGDELLGHGDRHSVAVIGDGALPSGIVFEALNNAGGLSKNLLVILNDNKMSICPRVGGLAHCLDRARLTNFYQDSKRHLQNLLCPGAAGRRHGQPGHRPGRATG